MWVIYRVPLDKADYLMHHGIKGQKWGKQNGPPYPLDYDDHSKAEKKLNSKTEIDGDPNTKRKAIGKKVGKALLITAGIAAVGTITYAAVRSGKLNSTIDLGKSFINSKIIGIDGSLPSHIVDKTNLGQTLQSINLKSKMIESINADVAGTYEGSINCFHTSTAYLLNSLFGRNVKALGFSNIDEFSGLAKAGGRDIKLFKSIFDNINIETVYGKSFDSAFKELKDGSTGIFYIGDHKGGHFVNYEKDIFGKVTIVDAQRSRNRIIDGNIWASALESVGFVPIQFIDFSNASLKENADNILKYIVK